MRRPLMLVTACLALIACGPPTGGSGGGGGGGGGGGALDTPAQIGNAVADAQCGYMMRCFSSRAYRALSGDDAMGAAACRTALNEPGEYVDRLKDALEAGTIVFNADQFTACRAAIASASCGDDLGDGPCGQITTGTVEEGGACFMDDECMDGSGEGECEGEGEG